MTAGPSTIAALLTPLAPGGIAVIGLAGPGVDAILAHVLHLPTGSWPDQCEHDRPSLCRIVDGGDILDDAVAVRSQRGIWEFAEINTHGGVRVAQRMLALVARHGAEIVAGASFLIQLGGIDPIERAVDQVLLTASARRLTQWLLSQRGILAAYLAGLKSLTAGDLAAFRIRSRAAIHLLAGLRVALIGPPNAGKSTLANRLIGTDRVITSEQPGTTRDWVSETALINGWPVSLTDTAGIRETSCGLEMEAIRRGRIQAQEADVVVIVLDATATQGERQKHLNAATDVVPRDRSRIVLLNKRDLASARNAMVPPQPTQNTGGCQTLATHLAPSQSTSGATPLPHHEPLLVSAVTGQGLEALEMRIASVLGLNLLDDALPTAFLASQLDSSGRP
jgi:tRNA modification GTPase